MYGLPRALQGVALVVTDSALLRRQMEDPAGPGTIASSLSSVNARLFPFAKQLRSRGHQVLIAGLPEVDQVCSLGTQQHSHDVT